MNTLVARSRADIVIFTDANVMFAPDTIPRLLRPFADPRSVACAATSSTPRRSAARTAATGSLYWRLEERIKEFESRTGSVMGADGSISRFAARCTARRRATSSTTCTSR